MDSFPETYNDLISFIGVLMGYLSYGHFRVCVTSAKTAPKDLTFLIFTNCSPFFPCFFTQHFFSKSLLEAEKENVIYC